MIKKLIILTTTVLVLSACQTAKEVVVNERPTIVQPELANEFKAVRAPDGPPFVVALYNFSDKTGQRKPNDAYASLSSAVTQGAEVLVIKALKEVGNGKWFRVVERVGIDDIVKERQMIRQTRETFEGTNAKPLDPMLFAGILIEGGVIGYDTNKQSGGVGAAMLGVGADTQYSQDVVTVSMRAVSVQTGEVLMEVSTTKNILSTGSNVTFFKFYDLGTQHVESEAGYTINEPVTYAVRVAIEAAVVELIKEGVRKKYWNYASKSDSTKSLSTKPVIQNGESK
jgi:curli production assembly/transport component CsgG